MQMTRHGAGERCTRAGVDSRAIEPLAMRDHSSAAMITASSAVEAADRRAMDIWSGLSKAPFPAVQAATDQTAPAIAHMAIGMPIVDVEPKAGFRRSV